MTSFLFVTGPPFDAPLWNSVITRIHGQGFSAHTFGMLESGDGTVEIEINRLAEHLLGFDDPVILVAHGTSIPVAIEACRKVQPSGLVLSNGALCHADRFTRLLIRWAQLPAAITQLLLSPTRTINILASSAGLRRLVVNPYVMDHDTTVAVCSPIIQSKARFLRMRNYLKTLPSLEQSSLPTGLPTLLCYGDADPLSSRNIEDFLNRNRDSVDTIPVPGGRYLHPIERPWELADHCVEWVRNSLTTT